MKKLLFEFCDSPYLEQEQLAETLAALQEIFYLYKNESLEELTDEELLSYMKEKFDGECRGDLELSIRNGTGRICKNSAKGHPQIYWKIQGERGWNIKWRSCSP